MPSQTDDFSSIASRLRWLRQQRNATLAAVAGATGLGVSYISRLESGTRRKPSEKAAASLAIFYRADREWILTGNGVPFSTEPVDQAKATLFAAVLEADPGKPDETRLEGVLSNIEVRVRQLQFSPEERRARLLREIWDELVSYSAACGQHYPQIKEALLNVAREHAKKEDSQQSAPQ